MSEKKPRRKYTQEFKLEAVQMVVSTGVSASEVARSLGIDAGILSRWVREYKADSQHAFPGLGKLKEPDEEMRRLKKELADTKMERDILKKALAIFSKTSR